MPDRFLEGVGTAQSAGDPFYIQGWFMIVILAAWVVVPLALGTWRFGNAQIG
jgi:ABC-2 type transport system permease protein